MLLDENGRKKKSEEGSRAAAAHAGRQVESYDLPTRAGRRLGTKWNRGLAPRSDV
jgi:hypothetical protein